MKIVQDTVFLLGVGDTDLYDLSLSAVLLLVWNIRELFDIRTNCVTKPERELFQVVGEGSPEADVESTSHSQRRYQDDKFPDTGKLILGLRDLFRRKAVYNTNRSNLRQSSISSAWSSAGLLDELPENMWGNCQQVYLAAPTDMP